MGVVIQVPGSGLSPGVAAALDQARLPNRHARISFVLGRHGQTLSGAPFKEALGVRHAGSTYSADHYEPLAVSGASALTPLAVRVTTACFLPVGRGLLTWPRCRA